MTLELRSEPWSGWLKAKLLTLLLSSLLRPAQREAEDSTAHPEACRQLGWDGAKSEIHHQVNTPDPASPFHSAPVKTRRVLPLVHFHFHYHFPEVLSMFLNMLQLFFFVEIKSNPAKDSLHCLFTFSPPKRFSPEMRKLKAPLSSHRWAWTTVQIMSSWNCGLWSWWHSLWGFPEGARGELCSLENPRGWDRRDTCNHRDTWLPSLVLNISSKCFSQICS